jgi:hypothetical protein
MIHMAIPINLRMTVAVEKRHDLYRVVIDAASMARSPSRRSAWRRPIR